MRALLKRQILKVRRALSCMTEQRFPEGESGRLFSSAAGIKRDVLHASDRTARS